MCHIQDLISNIEISLDNKDAFNFYDTNDFLISNIINQISNHSTNKIFYVTENSNKCRLIVEHLEDTWNKQTFYLGNDVLNSHLDNMSERNRYLNILHFLSQNNKINLLKPRVF